MEGLFSEADSSSLKLYLLPFPSPGHMMPQINLGQVLAFRGHHVTVLTTPSNAQFIPKHLKVHTFNLPSNEHGLSSENLSSAEDNRTAYKIWKATQDLKPQIETFLQQNPPHAVILDIMFPWNFSSTLNIATAVYNPMPIFALCVAEAINNSQHQAFPSDSSLSFVVPGSLPHNVTLNFNPWTTSFHTMARTMLQAKENNSVGVIVDTFAELEDGYTEYYQKLTGVKVWHVGKLSLMVDYYHRRGTSSQENHVSHKSIRSVRFHQDTDLPFCYEYLSFARLWFGLSSNFRLVVNMSASTGWAQRKPGQWCMYVLEACLVWAKSNIWRLRVGWRPQGTISSWCFRRKWMKKDCCMGLKKGWGKTTEEW